MNAMAPNAMAPNAMAPNAMAPNAMAPNALSPNALGATALASGSLPVSAQLILQAPTLEGAISRQLLKYAVSCALEPSQQVAVSWIDADGVVQDEVYTGFLGIAPGWASAPLTDPTQQRLVTGCLAARVNYYGVPVFVSLRSGAAALETGVDEVSAYPYVEGVFWGNLFAAAPYVNACFEAQNVAHSRAAMRDCAAGHVAASGVVVPCGIVAIAGPCTSVCNGFDSGGQFYTSCKDRPGNAASGFTTAVVTTALP
jgi:hypothetical protein